MWRTYIALWIYPPYWGCDTLLHKSIWRGGIVWETFILQVKFAANGTLREENKDVPAIYITNDFTPNQNILGKDNEVSECGDL